MDQGRAGGRSQAEARIGLDRMCIDVHDDVVELGGTILDERQRTALKVATENSKASSEASAV
jgi:hypothetical protein